MPLFLKFLKGKNSSRAVGLGKVFLWRQLIISPINTAAYYLPTVVQAKWWEVVLLSVAAINRQTSILVSLDLKPEHKCIAIKRHVFWLKPDLIAQENGLCTDDVFFLHPSKAEICTTACDVCAVGVCLEMHLCLGCPSPALFHLSTREALSLFSFSCWLPHTDRK